MLAGALIGVMTGALGAWASGTLCRSIPLVRSLISIPAGFAKMDLLPFFALTALGSAVWNTLLVCLGAGLGSAWQAAMPYLDQYTHIAAAALAAAAVLAAAWMFYRHAAKNS